MGELSDRRARKKAQTRDHIRRTAQALFAERGFEAVTIADVATAADVAVQTVFNHFASKEDLFFSERTPWVEGPAAAVRFRDDQTGPLAALRAHLIELVDRYMQLAGTPEHRRLMRTLKSSPALRAHERLLHFEAEERVRRALIDAWELRAGALDAFVPQNARLSAGVVAATWLGAIKALLIEQRRRPSSGNAADRAQMVHQAESVLDRCERILIPADTEPVLTVRAS